MAQGALGAAGVRRVWAGAGLQRAAYMGGAYRAASRTACFSYDFFHFHIFNYSYFCSNWSECVKAVTGQNVVVCTLARTSKQTENVNVKV